MIIGTPTSGVIALTGMIPRAPGATLSHWHNAPVAAPHSAVAGNSVR